MKIFVFYITRFSGHYKTAYSIVQHLKGLKNVEVKEIDLFRYLFPSVERVVNFLYGFTIKKLPFLWQSLYDRNSIVKSLGNFEKTIFNIAFERLNELFKEFNPHCVICTQAFPCILASIYKEKTFSNFLIFAVTTDFLPHRFWLNKEVDFYVVPTLEAKERLIENGVDPTEILEFGIPVRKEFFMNFDKEKILKEFGLPPLKPKVLLMGGNQGIGPIKELVKEFIDQKIDSHLIVVCARNKRLYSELKKINSPKVSIFEYVEEIYKLMDISDILISKAGGSTLTEALIKELYMIILNPLPGQESNNLEILSKHNLVFKAQNVKEAIKICKRIVEEENKGDLIKMKERIRKFKRKWNSKAFVNFVIEKCSTTSIL